MNGYFHTTAGHRWAHSGERGVTVVELLVAMVIGALLVTLVFVFFNTQAKSFHESRGTAEMQQELRWAMQFLSDHLKLAGNGVPTTCGWQVIENVNGSSGAPDSLTVLGSFKSLVIVTSQAMANEGSHIPCTTTGGVEAGDLVVISDGTFSEIFHVTNIQANHLFHETSQPWNDDDHFGHAYGAGSTVTVISQYSFSIVNDGAGHPNLMVKTQSDPPQILAGDVDQFQVRYKMKSGVWQDETAEVYDIREIEITLRARSPEPIQGYRDPVFGDGYRRIEIKKIVIPKNLVII